MRDSIELSPPTWAYAVAVYIAVLENPTASNEAKQAAREDLNKLAAIVDSLNNEE